MEDWNERLQRFENADQTEEDMKFVRALGFGTIVLVFVAGVVVGRKTANTADRYPYSK